MDSSKLYGFVLDKISDLIDIQDSKMQSIEEHDARDKHIADLQFILEIVETL